MNLARFFTTWSFTLACLLLTSFGSPAPAAGMPAFCYASSAQARARVVFHPYCRSIETALLSDGSFQFALDNIRRVHARLAFTALPEGRVSAVTILKPSGDALIDRALVNSLKTMRLTPRGHSPETFIMDIALQPVENMPGVVYRLGN